jgi:hypothetical protein
MAIATPSALSNNGSFPYVVLGFFGLYLYALSVHARNLRVHLLLMLLVFAALRARPLNRRTLGLLAK